MCVDILTASELVAKHRRLFGGAAVPALMSELGLTLCDAETCSVFNAGQQVGFLFTYVLLLAGQRQIRAAHPLYYSHRRDAQPPAHKSMETSFNLTFHSNEIIFLSLSLSIS